MRGRSEHGEAKPKVCCISALAGRKGRLRACHSEPSAMMFLVTTSIIKSDVFPALWAGWRPLFSGGPGFEVAAVHELE